MKRPLVAVVAALAAAVLLATTVAAVTLARDDDVRRVHAMMGSGAWGDPGPRADRGQDGWMHGQRGFMMHGPGGMHGAVARTEFAFLTQMIPHHQEAVDAAGELARSGRPEMRAFGRDIVATQTAQIEQMRAWLADWYPGRSTDVGYEPMMRDLSGLSGDRLDKVFLQDMIGHHMAAVMMSQQLLVRGAADHDQVNDLARTIRDEQHKEIFWMQDRLAEWFDAGWRHGWGGMGPGMMR